MTATEWQFDGLVGPTHNYAGLSVGNLASEKNAGTVSNPRAAAIQGLEKMQFVRGLGVSQAFIPPQKRDIISVLKQFGFTGGSGRAGAALVLEKAFKEAPWLLASCFSSSFMWAANAATVSPSADTADGRVHFTPANLMSNLHRALEAENTTKMLRKIFHNETLFKVHNPLLPTGVFSDEGAANHMRVCSSHKNSGAEIFVYGVGGKSLKKVKEFPARQHEQACLAIGRSHQLVDDKFIMVQQNPSVIDQGVFHNDVIAMNTTNVMIAHEEAFVGQKNFVTKLQLLKFKDFRYVEIATKDFSVSDAVSSYLFNSQLINIRNNEFILIAPAECEEQLSAKNVIHRLIENNQVVTTVHFLNVRESMLNGGGPACLRLRVVLTDEEARGMHSGIIITNERYAALIQWVNSYYRDRLSVRDLTDPLLLEEVDAAFLGLESITEMPGFYSQKS